MAVSGVRTSAKRTYSLDFGLVSRFEKLVPAGERSQVVEDLLARRVQEIEMDRLNTEIREGLSYMSHVYADAAHEWRCVEAERWPSE